MNTAERNIQYWRDYWTSLFSGIEYQRHRLNMLNPRVILREFVYEIESKQLKNNKNKEYFQRLINYYFKNDPPSISCLNDILHLIRSEFSNPRLAVLVHLCNEALSKIDHLIYFDSAVDHLHSALTGNKNIAISDIQLLCQDIIVELSEIGYSNKYIEKLPNRLFSGIITHNEHIHSEFPHPITYPVRNAPDSQKKEYYAKLTDYISRLTLSDRINALKSITRKPLQDLFIILQIKGVCGTNSFHIGDIKFYSPHTEILMTDSNMINFPEPPEYFHCKDMPKETSYYNAVIPIKARDLLRGVVLARNTLIKALNVLRYKFNSKAVYEISRDYIALNKDFKHIGSSSSLDPKSGILQFHNSLKINDSLLNSIKQDDIINNIAPRIISSRSGDINRKIGESLHWYRKAKEAESLEDQLLWFWICIENLLNPGIACLKNGIIKVKKKESPVSLAFDILPRLRAVSNAYERGWIVYYQLDNLVRFRLIQLPEDIQKQANLPPALGKLIYLYDFIKTLPSMLGHISDGLLLDHLKEIHKFYSNAKYAKEVVGNETQAFTDDLVLLYRIRNKIVHNADYEDSMLPFYIRSIESYAKTLLAKVTAKNHYGKSHVDILVALYSEYDLLMNKLDKATSCEFMFSKE